MNKIYNNLNIENIEKTEWFKQFNPSQQKQIKIGLKNNVNISIYAKTEFNGEQMKQIRWGLEDNLDVSVYAKSNLTHNQMNVIRYYKHI